MSKNIHVTPLAQRVHQADAGRFRVLALPTPIDRVVSFEASFRTAPDFASGEEIAQQLVVNLLDKGTQKRDRFELAEALDDRGARLHFSADGIRCSFSGRCLREDLPDVLGLAAEMLRQPVFDDEEFAKAKSQQIASVRRIMDDTGSQAHGLLARRMYEEAHPNYRPTAEDDLQKLEQLTAADIRRYHADHFGARDAVITAVGDLDPAEAEAMIGEVLGDWRQPGAAGSFTTEATPLAAGREQMDMPDRQNLDVRIGQPLRIRRDSDDYLALYAAVYVLGGNFAARLMSTVRDEQGLTYGIGARLAGVSVEHDAYFLTSVTLSGDKLEEGIDATMAQIRRFADEGITQEELEEKQTTLTGSFKVGMATTRGLAGALLSNAEREFPVDYLDRFPALIEALTVQGCNEAVRQHIDASDMHIAIAGTLPGELGT